MSARARFQALVVVAGLKLSDWTTDSLSFVRSFSTPLFALSSPIVYIRHSDSVLRRASNAVNGKRENCVMQLIAAAADASNMRKEERERESGKRERRRGS